MRETSSRRSQLTRTTYMAVYMTFKVLIFQHVGQARFRFSVSRNSQHKEDTYMLSLLGNAKAGIGSACFLFFHRRSRRFI